MLPKLENKALSCWDFWLSSTALQHENGLKFFTFIRRRFGSLSNLLYSVLSLSAVTHQWGKQWKWWYSGQKAHALVLLATSSFLTKALTVQDNSYRCCEYYCLPLHYCENGWRGTFFLQLLLSLNINIYLRNIQDTNKIFKRYQAGCCSLHKAKYSDTLLCLSVARDGFKNSPREKYFSLCSSPNVQSGGSTLGPLVKMALGHTFCHHLSGSSSCLASCKEPTGQRAPWLNEFLWEY